MGYGIPAFRAEKACLGAFMNIWPGEDGCDNADCTLDAGLSASN